MRRRAWGGDFLLCHRFLVRHPQGRRRDVQRLLQREGLAHDLLQERCAPSLIEIGRIDPARRNIDSLHRTTRGTQR